jgi:hypothetical protein
MPDGRVARDRSHEFDEVLAEGMQLIVGTPRTAVDTLQACLDQVHDRPSFYFAPAVQWGDITLEESLETLELLATDVAPALTGRAPQTIGAEAR